MSIIISADEIKEELPNYTPENAEKFHRESAKKADKLFSKSIKSSHYTDIVFLNGGSASGKTEFLYTQLFDKKYLILDETLSTINGFTIKLKQVYKLHKDPIIYAIIPDDLKRAFMAFLNRSRKFSDKHFYKTHSQSRKVLLNIAEKFPEIELHIIESSYTKDQKLQFSEILFRRCYETHEGLKRRKKKGRMEMLTHQPAPFTGSST